MMFIIPEEVDPSKLHIGKPSMVRDCKERIRFLYANLIYFKQAPKQTFVNAATRQMTNFYSANITRLLLQTSMMNDFGIVHIPLHYHRATHKCFVSSDVRLVVPFHVEPVRLVVPFQVEPV